MKYTARLVLLNSTHKPLRTSEVRGTCTELPQVGSSFHLSAPPLDLPWGTRHVITSEVKEVSHGQMDCYTFKTLNSTYELWIEDSHAD